ncbi:hypothetical protein [Streptomyces sp. NPDC058872]|uniref:hypothetical protein n=1 Tax=Streptomyces sp. NPDC058872 TaxID=3346661 RepID=UPI0036929AC9
MASERLTFTLEGRDHLSRVLGHAGESADRLRASMEDASDGSGRAILTLTQDADGRLRDMEGRLVSTADAAALLAHRTGELERPTTSWSQAADEAKKAGEALRKALISLAPAAIPAAASIAPLAPAVLAGAAAAGVYALAVGAQVAALMEASEAEKKYTDAVEESGATSEEAAKASVEYARAMAKLPPETRKAAAALSVLRAEYKDWSDSLAKDTMAPLTHSFGVMQALLPKLTPMVRGFAGELDRTITLAGGGVASPGFDAFARRMGAFSTGVLQRANDDLVHFLRTLDRDRVGEGIGEFMDWARAQGPLVGEVLRDLGEALVNVLDGASDVGVGMLQVVSVLAKLASAVPPETIAVLLQLAIAIKTVNLVMAGTAAARTALAAFGTQILAMRTAAAGAPGPLAAAGAAIGTLSRAAKIAIAGTGIGLLVILLSQLSSASRGVPADLDKMSSSIARFARTGELSGEAARILGANFGELETSLRTLSRPSNYEGAIQWIGDLVGIDSAPVGVAKEQIGALDDALAGLVRNGHPELAEAAISKVAGRMGDLTEGELRAQLTNYGETLKDVAFEAELTAEGMGLFGEQAQATREKLDAQKASADGLRQAIVALNDVNRQGISAQIAFEAAIDDSTKAAQENIDALEMVDGQLVLGTEKSRTAATALNNLAAKTDEATGAARESGASWETVNGIYEKGRRQLIKNAQQMGLTEDQAKALADQILKTPDKTARLRGNLEDLEAKLRTAKDKLGKVPDGRKAQIKANIAQLEAEIRRAKGQIASVKGKTVSIMIEYRTKNSGASDFTKLIGGYAGGGNPRAGEWAWVGEEGPELVQFRQAGTTVYDHRTSMDMVSGFTAVPSSAGSPALVPAGVAAGAVQPGRGVVSSGPTAFVTNVHIEGAMDPVRVGQEVQKVLIKLKRTNGGGGLGVS